MKTFEEKAADLTEDILSVLNSRHSGELVQAKAITQTLIESAMRNQDGDTRHACAEAVNRIALDSHTITVAHSAIMNVKAG